MLKFVVDPSDPLDALERVGLQIDLITDLVCQDGGDGLSLGEQAAAGLADLLRAASKALDEVSAVVRRVYPAGLEFIERAAAAPPPEAADAGPGRQDARIAMIRRLLDEPEGDSVSGGGGRAGASITAAGGGAAADPAPRLTEPRSPAARRRAA